MKLSLSALFLILIAACGTEQKGPTAHTRN